jgi:hypothetical protein
MVAACRPTFSGSARMILPRGGADRIVAVHGCVAPVEQ